MMGVPGPLRDPVEHAVIPVMQRPPCAWASLDNGTSRCKQHVGAATVLPLVISHQLLNLAAFFAATFAKSSFSRSMRTLKLSWSS